VHWNQLSRCGLHELERLTSFYVDGRDLKITPQIIAGTLLFKGLTSLQLLSDCTNVCQTRDLTDDDIGRLTNAMPRLESLSIGDQPCGAPSQITFKSLYTISRRCTRCQRKGETYIKNSIQIFLHLGFGGWLRFGLFQLFVGFTEPTSRVFFCVMN
jgi:hypothetical protein